jgi:outer membrane immunogenic protein
MKKLLLSGVVLAGLTVAPALGADLLSAPMPEYDASWIGCYVGAAGGGAWGRSRAENDGTTVTGGTAGHITITGNYDVRGGIVGVTTGCNLLQSHSWMFGIETDTSWTDKKGTANDLPPYSTATVNETKEEWLGTYRVRFGHLTNNWFLYATAGAAVANVRYSVTNPIIVNGGVSETHTRIGWTAGAGAEWAIDKHWSFKAEYLYVDFGGLAYFNFDGLIPTTTGGFVANRNGGVFLNDHVFRVGLNYKIGAFWPAGPKY